MTIQQMNLEDLKKSIELTQNFLNKSREEFQLYVNPNKSPSSPNLLLETQNVTNEPKSILQFTQSKQLPTKTPNKRVSELQQLNENLKKQVEDLRKSNERLMADNLNALKQLDLYGLVKQENVDLLYACNVQNQQNDELKQMVQLLGQTCAELQNTSQQEENATTCHIADTDCQQLQNEIDHLKYTISQQQYEIAILHRTIAELPSPGKLKARPSFNSLSMITNPYEREELPISPNERGEVLFEVVNDDEITFLVESQKRQIAQLEEEVQKLHTELYNKRLQDFQDGSEPQVIPTQSMYEEQIDCLKDALKVQQNENKKLSQTIQQLKTQQQTTGSKRETESFQSLEMLAVDWKKYSKQLESCIYIYRQFLKEHGDEKLKLADETVFQTEKLQFEGQKPDQQ